MNQDKNQLIATTPLQHEADVWATAFQPYHGDTQPTNHDGEVK